MLTPAEAKRTVKKLRYAISAYAIAEIDNSWRGSQPESEREEIHLKLLLKLAELNELLNSLQETLQK